MGLTVSAEAIGQDARLLAGESGIGDEGNREVVCPAHASRPHLKTGWTKPADHTGTRFEIGRFRPLKRVGSSPLARETRAN